jgi:hypothetical protein
MFIVLRHYLAASLADARFSARVPRVGKRHG